VRRVSSLAIPAFLASVASTVSLQDEILANCQLPECPSLTEHLQNWSLSFGQTPNPLPQKVILGPTTDKGNARCFKVRHL